MGLTDIGINIMAEYIILNEEPLFYWVVIAYFILLYHSFDIDEIQKKMKGVEVLFISVALGISLSFIFNLLYPLFNSISIWYSELKLLKSIPFTFNVFQRQLHEPFTTQMEYYAVGVFLILFVYFSTVFSIVIIIKIIQKFLDPNNDIYTGRKRFSIFTENKIPEIIIWGIPRFMSTIAVLILFLGIIVGYVLNISEITFNIEGFFKILLVLAFTILAILTLIILLNVVNYDLKLVYPIFNKIYNNLKTNYCNTKFKGGNEDLIKSKINTLFNKHSNLTIYLMFLLMISFSMTEYFNNQITFLNLILMITIPFVIMFFIFIYKPK